MSAHIFVLFSFLFRFGLVWFGLVLCLVFLFTFVFFCLI